MKKREVIENELDELLASFDTGPDANYSTAFLDQFITEMGGSGTVSESPKMITPFKPPPDVMAASKGKEKEHDEKEPRVGDTWKPVKVDEAKQKSARSLDTVFDLKELAASTGQQSSSQAPVPARPFQPVKATATGGPGAAPISLDSPDEIAALERELGLHSSASKQQAKPAMMPSFARPVVGTQPSPLPVPSPGSSASLPSFAIQDDAELTQLLQEISPATIKFAAPAASKPAAASIFGQPASAGRGQVIPTKSAGGQAVDDLTALLDDLTTAPGSGPTRSAAPAPSHGLKSTPSALAAAAAATRNTQQTRPAQPAQQARPAPATPPVSVESLDDLDAIERALLGEVTPTGFETLRPRPKSTAPVRNGPAVVRAPTSVSPVHRSPAQPPAPMPDVMDVFNSLDQIISVSENLKDKGIGTSQASKTVAPVITQAPAPGPVQEAPRNLQSSVSASAPRPAATLAQEAALSTVGKSAVVTKSSASSSSSQSSASAPKSKPAGQITPGSITPSYVGGWNSGVPAVGTSHQPDKTKIEQLLGPSPKDLAAQKQKSEQAKKEDEDLNNIISQLDSEVVKESESKQKEHEDRRKREEEIASKKKQHLDAIESLIDQLEIPDENEVQAAPAKGPQPSRSLSGSTPAIADLAATEQLRKSSSSPAAVKERQEYDQIQRKLKELASMTGQPLWSSKEGSKMDTKAVTATIKQTVDQAKALADASGTSPERRDEIIELARDCVASLGPFLLGVKAFDEMLDDMRAYRRASDREAVADSIKNLQQLHSKLMSAYELVLESYIYSNGVGSGRAAPSSRTPESLDTPAAQPKREFNAEQAKNAILYSFRDFYQNTTPPPPDTIGYLNYTPAWVPAKSMREYCHEAIQLFKPLVEHINSPFLSFDFKAFSDLISQEIELLVPVAKMIQHDKVKYAAFDKFPLGIKVFINAVIVFLEAVNVYKQSGAYASSVELATANHRRDELSNALKMLLATIRKLLV